MSNIVEQIKGAALEFVEDVKKSINKVKENKTLDVEELRVLNLCIFGLWSLSALLFPSLLRAFVSGFALTDSCADQARVTSETIRIYGAFAVTMVLFLVQAKKSDANVVISNLTFFYLLLTVVYGLILYGGGSYLYLLCLLVSGVLTFAHGKATKLFEKNK